MRMPLESPLFLTNPMTILSKMTSHCNLCNYPLCMAQLMQFAKFILFVQSYGFKIITLFSLNHDLCQKCVKLSVKKGTIGI